MNLLLSTVSMAFGVFVAVSPVRAAKIWAAGRLDGLEPERRTSFLWWYRVFGIILFLGGFLSALDNIGFSNSLWSARIPSALSDLLFQPIIVVQSCGPQEFRSIWATTI